jgi:hypothetical protein
MSKLEDEVTNIVYHMGFVNTSVETNSLYKYVKISGHYIESSTDVITNKVKPLLDKYKIPDYTVIVANIPYDIGWCFY